MCNEHCLGITCREPTKLQAKMGNARLPSVTNGLLDRTFTCFIHSLQGHPLAKSAAKSRWLAMPSVTLGTTCLK